MKTYRSKCRLATAPGKLGWIFLWLIGVLNLQALPRILSLDFRDIFARGFSFDELGGPIAG